MARMTKPERQARAQQNKDRRAFFLNMGSVIGAPLCTFCRYGVIESLGGCCDGGYTICEHPLPRMSEDLRGEMGDALEPGEDCWGFNPQDSREIITEIVTAILVNNIDVWSFRRYSKTEVTVWGFTGPYEEGGQKSIKVRIGHDGKPDNEKEKEESN